MQWLQDLGANFTQLQPLPVVSVRRIGALSSWLFCLYFGLFRHCETTKWDNTTSTCFCCLKLHGALWQSNVQALAGWSTEVNKNINKKTSFLSYLARECFHFLCNWDPRELQKWAVHIRLRMAIIIPKTRYRYILYSIKPRLCTLVTMALRDYTAIWKSPGKLLEVVANFCLK